MSSWKLEKWKSYIRPQRMAAVGGAILLLYIAAFCSMRRSSISQINFDLIQEGMPLQEVEGLLGPPRDESTGVLLVTGEEYDEQSEGEKRMEVLKKRAESEAFLWFQWVNDAAVITVAGDGNGHVKMKHIMHVRKKEEDWLTRCRRLLHF